MKIEIKEQNGTKLTVEYNESKKAIQLSLTDYEIGMSIDLDNKSLLSLKDAIGVITLTNVIQ